MVVVLAYANSFAGGFVLDAKPLVLENPMLRAAGLSNVLFLLTRDYWQPTATGGVYRPITSLSYLVNYAVLGDAERPQGYHAVNLALHLGCVTLVYALVWHLVRRVRPAWVAAAVFGLHPVATESVANIAGRADLLATLGVLGGLVCHVRAAAATERRRLLWLIGLGLSALVGVFSKENGIVLVALIIIYDLLFRLPRPRAAIPRLLRGYLPLVPVIATFLVARWFVHGTGPPPVETSPVDNPIVEAGFWAGRLTAVKVIGRQAGLVLWPMRLSADYSYDQIPVVHWPPRGWEDWQGWVWLAALALFAWGAIRLRRRPELLFLILFSCVALLPTANLVTIIGSIMAERFLYLPMVGVAGVVALTAEWASRAGTQRRTAVTTVVALVLLASGWRTSLRNRDWASDLTLWASAVAASPASAKAHKGYAAALYASDAAHGNIDHVIAEAERAVAIRGDYLLAMIDLGGYYVTKGDSLAAEAAQNWYEKSAALLGRARALDGEVNRAPLGNAQLYNNLTLAYVRLRRFDEALAACEYSRRLDPFNPKHYTNIAAILCNLGRWEEGAIVLWEALVIKPDDSGLLGRLVAVYGRFDPEGGAVVVDPAGGSRLDPAHPAVRRHRCQAYRDLAGVYTEAREATAAARVRTLGASACPGE